MLHRRSTQILFFVFAVSGFSGLIYESIWTYYLKLFLGHAAYAQSLVLAILMGGMALGSGICSRYSFRWKNLLIGYAVAEGLIGVFALLFHSVFDQSIQISYDNVIPHLDSAALAYAYKWIVSALLILPQAVLLGMTFPLMSAGILRLSSDNQGRTISLLYFANSLGAAIGVLVSGFILIRLLGLPWTIRAAGLVNIVLAAIVWTMATRQSAVSPADAGADNDRQPGSSRYPLFLLVALVTGFASFIYEIGWIRMLGLVMGSSTHAFELMLSAFILGLACGGLWIQGRIDRIERPERYLAGIQVIMGLLALSTLPLYGQTFNVMKWLLHAIDKTPSGYVLFNLSSNAIALAIMLPATFCAGMTLPLITVILLRHKLGERSIGAVYAANTVGAILGVFFAIQLGMPLLGLKGLMTFGAGCDIALGVLLYWMYAGHDSKRIPMLATATGLCAVVAVVFLVGFDAYKLASGVYRTGMFLYPQLTDVISHEDGKTASISIYTQKRSGVVVIATNGKPDAAVGLNLNAKATDDEPTMILLGVLPMLFHPAAATVANIGLGSGLTTHTLLGYPGIKLVDTVEIEKAVVKAGSSFLPRVSRVFADPRSAIHIDDAKTFFSVHRKQYDVIVSEPSNPWVSGVAGLFSEEFYRVINQHLNPDGVFVQWVQLYEIDTELVLSILKTISNNFSDFAAYSTSNKDMIIVARRQGTLPPPDSGMLEIPDIAAALQRIDVRSPQDIDVRKIGNKKLFRRMLAVGAIPVNSDYDPVIDQNAARARFLDANASDVPNLLHGTGPLLEMLMGEAPAWSTTGVTPSSHLLISQDVDTAMAIRDYCISGRIDPGNGTVSMETRQLAQQLLRVFNERAAGADPMGRQIGLYNGLVNMVPYLRPREMEGVWTKLESGAGADLLSIVERNWIALFKSISTRNAAEMQRSARIILEGGQRFPPEVLKFVVAYGMLGSLMQGDRNGAFRLWAATRTAMFPDGRPDLLFRLLVAETSPAN